jgi:hypothetical protein
MLREPLKRFVVIRALRTRKRAAIAQLRGIRRGFARRMLTAGLVVVYFAVVAPVGILRRALLGTSLARPGSKLERGWRPIRQSSADKRIYLSEY